MFFARESIKSRKMIVTIVTIVTREGAAAGGCCFE
jgi:hypothetical protein